LRTNNYFGIRIYFGILNEEEMKEYIMNYRNFDDLMSFKEEQ